MSTGLLVTLELILVIGVVLGWAIWELVSLNRGKKRNDRPERHDDSSD
jgi:hypothetical protein